MFPQTQKVELPFLQQVVLFLISGYILEQAWNIGLSHLLHLPEIQYKSSTCLLLCLFILAKTVSVAISGFWVEIDVVNVTPQTKKEDSNNDNSPPPPIT